MEKNYEEKQDDCIIVIRTFSKRYVCRVFRTDEKRRRDLRSGGTIANNPGDGLYVADYLPDTTYNDADFRVLTVPDEYADMYTGFMADSSATDKVVAARYKRNSMIEDKYKVKFSETLAQNWEECSSMLETYVSTNDDAYELNMLIQREAFVFAIDGYCIPTSELKYNDLTPAVVCT